MPLQNALFRAATLTGLGLLAIGFAPRVAEAQVRGTLQASARVIDTRPSLDALQSAHGAARGWLTSRSTSLRVTASTVAQVTVGYGEARADSAASPTLLVTIDYLTN